MISIIIPAFEASSFLNECIESIKSSKFKGEYEILLGIDSCESTLEHVKNNYIVFDKVDVFYFEENIGPYAIKNTLSNLAKHENLLFFDSDDIIKDDTLDIFSEKISETDFVRMTYTNFDTHSVNIGTIDSQIFADAVIGIKKNIFNDLNGFYPWRCAADSEFSERLLFNKKESQRMPGISYYRRIHGNNLTVKEETNLISAKRAEYRNIINKSKANHDFPNPQVKFISNYKLIKL